MPIDIAYIWRRLISKVAMKGINKDVVQYLNDFQFGVGVSYYADTNFHNSNGVLSKRNRDGSLAMLTVDFSKMLSTW